MFIIIIKFTSLATIEMHSNGKFIRRISFTGFHTKQDSLVLVGMILACRARDPGSILGRVFGLSALLGKKNAG